MKKLSIASLPEYYLLVLILLAGYAPPFSFNPLVLVLVAILVLQIVFKNKITGIIIAGLFVMMNLYMILALIAEFNEFPTFSTDAKKLLFGGSAIIAANLFAAGAMLVKYAQNELRNFILPA